MFVEGEKICEELKEIGQKVDSVYESLYVMLSNVEILSKERPSYSDDDFRQAVYREAQHFYQFRDKLLAKTADDLASYRKRLFGSLRVYPFAEEKRSEPSSQEDGVLVIGARRLQQWLRAWME